MKCIDEMSAETFPKTGAQRQAELKARRVAAGLVPVTNLWAHADDVPPIRDHAAKLARRRAKLAAPRAG